MVLNLRDPPPAHNKHPNREVVILFSRVSLSCRVNSISQRIKMVNPLRVIIKIRDWTILGLVGGKLRVKTRGREVLWYHKTILCKIAKESIISNCRKDKRTLPKKLTLGRGRQQQVKLLLGTSYRPTRAFQHKLTSDPNQPVIFRNRMVTTSSKMNSRSGATRPTREVPMEVLTINVPTSIRMR